MEKCVSKVGLASFAWGDLFLFWGGGRSFSLGKRNDFLFEGWSEWSLVMASPLS